MNTLLQLLQSFLQAVPEGDEYIRITIPPESDDVVFHGNREGLVRLGAAFLQIEALKKGQEPIPSAEKGSEHEKGSGAESAEKGSG